MKGLIFVYLMTYGGAVASLFNPYAGLLVYICFATIRPESLWHWSLAPGGNFSRIIAIGMLAGWALHGFGNWNISRARGITLAFVAFWCWALISAVLVAQNQAKAFWYLETLAKVLLPFLVGITVVDSVEKLKGVAWTIVVSMGYVAYDLNQSYYSGYNRLYWDGYGGMDNNSFSIALVCGIGFSLFLGLSAEKIWQKAVALLATLFMINAVFFSFSRGGMLALIFMSFAAFLLVPKSPKHYVLFAVMVVLGIRLAGPSVIDRFVTVFADGQERDKSAQSRLDMWADCYDVMLRYPVFGVGPENWGEIAPEYGWPKGKYAHSLWMQTGAELGFVGVGLLLSFYLLCIASLWPLTWRSTYVADPWLRDVARMVIAALVGFMIAAQFVSLWGLELPYYVVLVGACSLKLQANAIYRGMPAASPHQVYVAPLQHQGIRTGPATAGR